MTNTRTSNRDYHFPHNLKPIGNIPTLYFSMVHYPYSSPLEATPFESNTDTVLSEYLLATSEGKH